MLSCFMLLFVVHLNSQYEYIPTTTTHTHHVIKFGAKKQTKRAQQQQMTDDE